jgi:hypothetical protein
MCRSAVEMVKKLLQFFWFMWPNHENIVDVSEPFSGFVLCCIQFYFFIAFRILVYYWPREIVSFPLQYPLFADRIYAQTGSTQLLHRCLVIPLCFQLVKMSVVGKKDPNWVDFVWLVRLLPPVRWWIKYSRAISPLNVELRAKFSDTYVSINRADVSWSWVKNKVFGQLPPSPLLGPMCHDLELKIKFSDSFLRLHYQGRCVMILS